jgi:hypothetical protein
MLTEKSTERRPQPQMKKKGTALLAGYSPYIGTYAHYPASQRRLFDRSVFQRGAAEERLAAERSVEGVQSEDEQDGQAGEPNARVPGG